MGQKVNPVGLRLPMTRNWASKWFATREFSNQLVEDIRIRDYIMKKMAVSALIEKVEIERNRDTITVKIYTARPGVIIGRSGKGINDLKIELEKNIFKNKLKNKIKIDIMEVKNPELSASLVAKNVGSQISRRISYRRACKQAIEKTIQKGAKGIKINVAGRLGGAEIARSEKFNQGTVPSGRFRANIDYSVYHAPTTFGTVGIKVWIYQGDRQNNEE